MWTCAGGQLQFPTELALLNCWIALILTPLPWCPPLPLELTEKMLPLVRKAKAGGAQARIVNVSSRWVRLFMHVALVTGVTDS